MAKSCTTHLVRSYFVASSMKSVLQHVLIFSLFLLLLLLLLNRETRTSDCNDRLSISWRIYFCFFIHAEIDRPTKSTSDKINYLSIIFKLLRPFRVASQEICVIAAPFSFSFSKINPRKADTQHRFKRAMYQGGIRMKRKKRKKEKKKGLISRKNERTSSN